MKFFVLILFSICFEVFSQNGRYYGDLSEEELLCNILSKNVISYSDNSQAEKALSKIISVTGITKRFVLFQCNGIKNCYAISVNGIKYIFYDSDFMNSINKDSGNEWSNISILAHEIGHHVYGHALEWFSLNNKNIVQLSLVEKRQQELEADEFSGFVMCKLGATLTQAQLAVISVSTNGDDTYSTHPNKSKRLNAIEKGFKLAKKQPFTFKVENLTALDYFYLAYNESLDNLENIINNYTKAIELDPKFSFAYTNRGFIYNKLGKYNDAITDCTRAIELDPEYACEAYNNRGLAHNNLGNYSSAIKDYTKAIELDSNFSKAYYNRGNAYYHLGNLDSAILEYSSAIKLDSNFSFAYNNRGNAYNDLGDYLHAIIDCAKAIELNPNFSKAYNNSGNAYRNLKYYEIAILKYNKAIEIDTNYGEAYFNRGVVKKILGRNSCDDFKKACSLGVEFGCKNYKVLNCE